MIIATRHTLPLSKFTLAIFSGLCTMNALAADTPDYSLTVYSSAQPGQISTRQLENYGANLPGYALVRDARKMQIEKGVSDLRFTDVATAIDPTTVSFESLTDPSGTRVIEQNYQYDLVSQEKLLQRYVGSRITVEQQRGDKTEATTGVLLSANGGMILQQDNGQVLTLNGYHSVQFPSLPGGLITKPTLVWKLNAAQGGNHDARVSYQTAGMTWWADYNITMREDENSCEMDLSAWVTMVNQSGGSFPAAKLKLVAGEVNRAPAAAQPQAYMMKSRAVVAEMAADAGFQESSLSEYHLYTLGRRTDIPDNSTKQIELFPTASKAKCVKQLVFTASPQAWSYWGAPINDQGYGATNTGTVGAYLEFKNEEKNQLGMPLPAGRMRVNQANSSDGALEFIGEDVIKHTPRNETIRLKLGNSFDVVGERKQTNYVYDEKAKYIEESFELSIRNRKKTVIDIVAREYLYRWSKWNVTQKDHEFVKQDAQTIDFPLRIAADTETKVRYTVRYSW